MLEGCWRDAGRILRWLKRRGFKPGMLSIPLQSFMSEERPSLALRHIHIHTHLKQTHTRLAGFRSVEYCHHYVM